MASTFWPRCAAAFAWGALSFTTTASFAADPPKERYYFELEALTPKAELKAEAVKAATPRVLAELKKAFEHHPQIVVRLEGAPDPKADPDAYRQYLEKSHITGAFAVHVELTDATETSTPVTDKPGTQEHETRLALRMLGTRIPDETLGFTGHGKASAKGDGAKASERERQETWDQLSELAVSKAMTTALEELTLAAKAKPKPKSKPKPASKPAPAP
jgi:hypothetical protein